ncbi:MAG: roadblock/LC7 domain-containing protein, partial [Paracoccus sp. (in: a-proteobacteria)]
HVGAMSAAVLSIGERTAAELSRGELEQVLIKGSRGYIVVTHTGPDAVITVLAKSTAKLGLVFLDVRRAAEKIAKVLEDEL